MTKFNSGDVVRIKSGGPKMTVSNQLSSGEVICQWFAGNKSEKNTYRPDMLEKVDDEDKK